MRHTAPLTAEENAVDLAMRRQHRTHAAQDKALTLFRLAVRTKPAPQRAERLERVADLLLSRR